MSRRTLRFKRSFRLGRMAVQFACYLDGSTELTVTWHD
jgi:predicted AAA+ superfamily ATPase